MKKYKNNTKYIKKYLWAIFLIGKEENILIVDIDTFRIAIFFNKKTAENEKIKLLKVNPKNKYILKKVSIIDYLK